MMYRDYRLYTPKEIGEDKMLCELPSIIKDMWQIEFEKELTNLYNSDLTINEEGLINTSHDVWKRKVVCFPNTAHGVYWSMHLAISVWQKNRQE